MKIDFQDIKSRVLIEQVAHVLQLDLKESNGEVKQFRSACPTCKAGGDRALAVTPGKGYYCNADKRGGDVIALVSHIKGIGARQSAKWLVAEFNLAGPPLPPPVQAPTPASPTPVDEDLQPLKNLDAVHEAVKALKLPQDVAEALGAGYCTKGMMKGLVAFPLRLPSGKLIGYIGITEGKLPTKWRLT